MIEIPWTLVLGLSATGIAMALLSSLVGLRQWLEIPLWWALYATWIAIVLATGATAPFQTILVASIFAGILHSITQSLLIKDYIRNNPWYSAQLQRPRSRIIVQFLVQGVLIGAAFGALVGSVAWALVRWVV